MPYIEGTIGAGKSSFLRLWQEHMPEIATVQEPVQKWVDIGILQAFYEDPRANAYKFQTYTFLTRWKAMRDLRSIDSKSIVVERSIYSDRFVFAEGLHEDGMISDMEWAMYMEWWTSLQELEREVGPSDQKFVYLRASPDVAFARMQKRNRDGESGVPFEYICKNIERHDRWLLALPPNEVLVIDVDEDFEHNPELFQQHVARIRAFLSA
jgi:deoxyadenosine/deoxycytidine kinase